MVTANSRYTFILPGFNTSILLIHSEHEQKFNHLCEFVFYINFLINIYSIPSFPKLLYLFLNSFVQSGFRAG